MSSQESCPDQPAPEVNIMMSKDGFPIVTGVTRMQDADGFVGTIVYMGSVASAKDPTEVYAGIVWDDPSRGKHNGSVVCRQTNRIVQHFHCDHPHGASFVKRSKVHLGVALDKDVLQSKYVTQDAPLVAPDNVLDFAMCANGTSTKPIEFYGEQQVRSRQQLPDLHAISVRRMGIARISATAGVEFSHLREMDLAGNLLSDWSTVLEILQQFPNLQSLSVASNRIRDPSEELMTSTQQQQQCYPNLITVNLNQCGIQTFRTVQWISRLFPQLQDLCLAHADLSDVTGILPTQDTTTAPEADHAAISSADNVSPSYLFPHLERLDCSHCHWTRWDQQVVPFVSTLPCLNHLSLDDNPLTTTNTSTTMSKYFSRLESLQLSGTQIASWQDLDGINAMAELHTLRFRKCPLLSTMGTSEARALTMARIPGLKKLNASPISDKERIEAERRYVSMVACDMLERQWKVTSAPTSTMATTTSAAKSDQANASAGDGTATGGQGQIPLQPLEPSKEAWKEDFLRGHPQFSRLLEKHKDAIIAANAAVAAVAASPRSVTGDGGMLMGSPTTQPHNMMAVVNVTIISMAPSSCHLEPLVRRLPGGLTVGRLKSLCSRSFGLDMDLQSLHVRNSKDDAFPAELDDDDHTLAYYGVQDGADILMNEIDLQDQQEQQKQAEKDRETRIIQQEAQDLKKQRQLQHLKQQGQR